MRAKPWGLVIGRRLVRYSLGYSWVSQEQEEESSRRMIESSTRMEISILEDGRLMVVTRDNPTKFYADEDALRVALTLQGVRVDEQ